jgi:hypothetical protein
MGTIIFSNTIWSLLITFFFFTTLTILYGPKRKNKGSSFSTDLEKYMKRIDPDDVDTVYLLADKVQSGDMTVDELNLLLVVMYGESLYGRPTKRAIIFSTRQGDVVQYDRLEVMSPSYKWRTCTVVAVNTTELQIHYDGFPKTFPGALEWIRRTSHRFNQTGETKIDSGGGRAVKPYQIPKENAFTDLLESWDEDHEQSEWQGWWAPPGKRRRPRRKGEPVMQKPRATGILASTASTAVELLAGRAIMKQLSTPKLAERVDPVEQVLDRPVSGWSFIAKYRDMHNKMQENISSKVAMKDMLQCWQTAGITQSFHKWRELTFEVELMSPQPQREGNDVDDRRESIPIFEATIDGSSENPMHASPAIQRPQIQPNPRILESSTRDVFTV